MKAIEKPRNNELDASSIVLFRSYRRTGPGKFNFGPAFALLERLFTDGAPESKTIAAESILKGLQRSSITKTNGPELFGCWMGRRTKRVWAAICKDGAQQRRPARPPLREKPERLREYKVALTECAPGERAIPRNYREVLGVGMATKLGGDADWLQGDERPDCPFCKKPMKFVGQIDSIEHKSEHNPHGRAPVGEGRHWMFGDVGMIYVFFCLDCLETRSVFQCH